MKRRIFILMIALAICAAAYIAYNYNELKTGNKAGGPQSSISSVKVKAQDFKLQGLDGKELSLNDLKGKKVFLNFWATWCPPCRGEMPDIQKIYEENKDSDLVIVAVDIGEPASNVNTFVEYNKYSFKVLLDSDQSIAKQYNISGIPTSFFIDKEGNIVSKHTGAMSLDQMKEYVKAMGK